MMTMLNVWAKVADRTYEYQLTEGGQFTYIMEGAIALRVPTTEGRPMHYDEFIPQILEDFKKQAKCLTPRKWQIFERDGELYYEVCALTDAPVPSPTVWTKAKTVRFGNHGAETSKS